MDVGNMAADRTYKAWLPSGTETFSDSYEYDGLSRLVNSTRRCTSDYEHEYINDYVYDVHSNIISSTVRDENGIFTMEDFTHDGNKLIAVDSYSRELSDRRTTRGKNGRRVLDNYQEVAYSYDQNGRLTFSNDYDMTEIRYNDVGYPSYVGMSDGGYVQNTYTAGGLRLSSRRNTRGGVVTAMTHEGNAVIENGKLRMLLFDGGYVDFSGSEPRYCWYTRDHLGSVRAVADAKGNVIASYAYDPYGEDFAADMRANSTQGMGSTANNTSATNLMLTSPSVTYSATEASDWQPYRFSGKESLTRVDLNLYDFGARMFSPFNMRWMTMDPLAEKYYHISPYAYCAGNPVNLVDWDGREVFLKGDRELEMIRETLPEGARTYVRINENGFIDKQTLHDYVGDDYNYSNLLSLVDDNTIVFVSINDSFDYISSDGRDCTGRLSYFPPDEFLMDPSIEIVSGLTTGESGNYGKTLFPDRVGAQNSTSKMIEIYLHPSLSSTGAAEAFSHEGYGHALLYIKNGHDHEGASHQPQNWVDKNTVLVNMILNARRATIKNLRK